MITENIEEDVNAIESWDDTIAKWTEAGYPYLLAKACVDPFGYEVLLKNGVMLSFFEANPVSAKFCDIRRNGDERWLEIAVDSILLISEQGNKYQSVYDWAKHDKSWGWYG